MRSNFRFAMSEVSSQRSEALQCHSCMMTDCVLKITVFQISRNEYSRRTRACITLHLSCHSHTSAFQRKSSTKDVSPRSRGTSIFSRLSIFSDCNITPPTNGLYRCHFSHQRARDTSSHKFAEHSQCSKYDTHALLSKVEASSRRLQQVGWRRH